jgi:hypothetical protein
MLAVGKGLMIMGIGAKLIASPLARMDRPLPVAVITKLSSCGMLVEDRNFAPLRGI